MKYKHFIIAILFALLSAQLLKAETFKAGSYIINMGVLPQTYDNGLKPYGMVYDMVINKEVPLYWIIRSDKLLFETDFTYAGTDYKAGSLVLPAIYVTDEIRTAIDTWRAEGVEIDGPTSIDFDAPVYNYISSFPNAVVDKQNVALTENLFYNHTSIPKSYYATGTPADIDVCCDVYALPHADPQDWSAADKATYLAYTDGKAQSFLWQGCHSVGAVEAHKPDYLGMYILTTNGQISWKPKGGLAFENKNSPNYLYETSAGNHPIMQIASPLDDSSISSQLPGVDFDVTADVTIHTQHNDGFIIEKDAMDINISTHVVIEAKKFELGENVTINILSGGSLTLLIAGDAKFKKNSAVITADGSEQFLVLATGKVELGDDKGTESYSGFFYSGDTKKDGLKVKKKTTVTGAVTSNGNIKIGDASSVVNYDAAGAAVVDTSRVTHGSTGKILFPQAKYVIGDRRDDGKPIFNPDFGNGNDGDMSIPAEIDVDMNYITAVVITSAAGAGNNASSALQDGSQKIYIPRPDSAWRSTTTVAVWDPDNVNLSLNGGNPNKAALVAYGRAFGDPANGVLVQHTSHTASTGTEDQNVASARIYGNLLLQASIEKRPIVTIHAPNQIFYPNEYNMTATVKRGAAPFDFDWDITCPVQPDGNYSTPGTFTPSTQVDVNESHVIFKPNNNTLSNCILRVKVTDYCGRKNFATKILGITGYHPPLGYYNVTHTGAVFPSGKDPLQTSDPVNSLYTQISGKDFNVTLVALQSDKETLNTTKSGNVILEMIDTAGVTELTPESCAEASVYSDETSKIALVGNGGHFNNSATVNANGIRYSNAIREIGFRVSYYDLPLPAGDSYAYGIPTTMTKSELDHQFPSCASDCAATRTDWGCYQCIAQSAYVGGYGKAVCARDNFAVRPASFSLNLSGTTPFIGGRTYPLQLNAVKYGGVAIDTWYTESTDANASLLFAPTEDANITSSLVIPSGCSLLEDEPVLLDDIDIIFTSGVGSLDDGSSILFSYPDIGDINITAVENKWVAVDKAKTYTVDNGGVSITYIYSDCIEGNSSNIPLNGKIGCMTEGENTATFIPSGFRNTLSVENYNIADGFTYIADNDGVNSSYGAKAELTFTAVIDDNTSNTMDDNPVAGNYVAGCYANDIETMIDLRVDTDLTTQWNSRFGSPQSRIWLFDINSTTNPFQDTVPVTYNYPDTIFDANNGEANGTARVEILFNFDREIDTPDNPFRVAYSDFNITDVHDEINTAVIGSDFNRTAGNSNESNATFYYARARSSKFFYEDIEANSEQTPISVVVYCDTFPSCSELDNEIKINEPYWWLAVDHNETNGDGNITLEVGDITPAGGSATVGTNVTIISNGTDESIAVTKTGGSLPLLVEIDLDTSSNTTTNKWLIYNKFNSISDPDPFYKLLFIGGGSSGWAGYGKTGNVIDSDANRKKLKRLEW